MGLVNQLKLDVAAITGNTSEFGMTAVLTAPNASTATVSGIFTKHHIEFDEMGNQVNTRQACITISEAPLLALSYPTRNADGEIDFSAHKVVIESITYVCDQWREDNTAGTILLILGDFES